VQVDDPFLPVFAIAKTNKISFVGIAAKPIDNEGSCAYRYGNYLLKISESVGVRMIEVSIPAFEERSQMHVLIRLLPLRICRLRRV